MQIWLKNDVRTYSLYKWHKTRGYSFFFKWPINLFDVLLQILTTEKLATLKLIENKQIIVVFVSPSDNSVLIVLNNNNNRQPNSICFNFSYQNTFAKHQRLFVSYWCLLKFSKKSVSTRSVFKSLFACPRHLTSSFAKNSIFLCPHGSKKYPGKKSLQSGDRFQKLPVSPTKNTVYVWAEVVSGEKKAPFSKISGYMWTGSYWCFWPSQVETKNPSYFLIH